MHATMMKAIAALALAGSAAWAAPLAMPEPQPLPPRVSELAAGLAAEFASHCPVVAANDTAAYNECRRALFASPAVRAALPPVLLWGRQSRKPAATLRQTNLTQFVPDVWTGMYAPLFMFNGKHTVEWVPEEKKYLVRLEAAFRNRLTPGQYPYPFWHDEEKWVTYEKANGFMLWLDESGQRIVAAQFTDRAPNALLQPVQTVQRSFDGSSWMWTDEQGRTQPMVTLFDGLYRADNPFLRSLDRQYRDLALQLRESQCTKCHVPSNPEKLPRLVVLATPAHAAGTSRSGCWTQPRASATPCRPPGSGRRRRPADPRRRWPAPLSSR